MIKRNKTKIIISSIIILLPMLFGIIMWEKLPDIITTHFGADGNADGFGTKAFAVFGIPILFLILHFIALLSTSLDKRQKNQTDKALGIIIWLIPLLSLVINIIIYCVSLQRDIDPELLLPILFGILFILMGNYLPKIKQNRTLGIKVSWALQNEENWNKTHRFGGKVMVGGGFLVLLSAFFGFPASLIALISAVAAIAVAPTAYSYLVYKDHLKAGIEYAPRAKSKGKALLTVILAVLLSAAIIGIAVIMFTGDIEVDCNESSLEINATYYTDIKVDYSEFDSVEYRRELNVGTRINGFGSARLLLGIFKNDEFGSYTIYAYTGSEEFIVLTADERTLVIGMRDKEDAREIYETISEKIGDN